MIRELGVSDVRKCWLRSECAALDKVEGCDCCTPCKRRRPACALSAVGERDFNCAGVTGRYVFVDCLGDANNKRPVVDHSVSPAGVVASCCYQGGSASLRPGKKKPSAKAEGLFANDGVTPHLFRCQVSAQNGMSSSMSSNPEAARGACAAGAGAGRAAGAAEAAMGRGGGAARRGAWS